MEHVSNTQTREAADPAPGAETRLTAILGAQRAISAAGLEVGEVVTTIVEQAQRLTGAAAAVVELVDGEEMVYRATGGTAAPYAGMRLRIDSSMSGLCIRSGEILHCTDCESDERVDREACRRVGARSLVVVPLPGREGVLGVLKVYSPERDAFERADVQSLELVASLLASSIDAALRFETSASSSEERARGGERALREGEERFRSLTENSHDLSAIIAADGATVYASPSAEKVLGYSAEELVGRGVLTLIHPGDRAAFGALFQRALDNADETIPYELRVRHRDGTYRWLDGVLRNLLAHPAVRGIVANSRDVTERVVVRQRLEMYARELERSNRELQDFADVASHDLQEPLRKIQAFGDRLKGRYADALDSTGHDYLERMQSAAGRMQVLIRDLLAYSRVTSEARPYAPVDPGRIAADVVQDLETQIERTGGRVDVGPLPGIDADAVQLRQMLQNLISNALKFHREGVPPEVQVSGTLQGGMAELRIADNGIGFEERYLDRIFTPFERLHGRGVFEGTGIGLAICRKIAHRHGGEITARSTPGEGSTFLVTLPLHQARPEGTP
jgi:PAS domain S-box-containing protein